MSMTNQEAVMRSNRLMELIDLERSLVRKNQADFYKQACEIIQEIQQALVAQNYRSLENFVALAKSRTGLTLKQQAKFQKTLDSFRPPASADESIIGGLVKAQYISVFLASSLILFSTYKYGQFMTTDAALKLAEANFRVIRTNMVAVEAYQRAVGHSSEESELNEQRARLSYITDLSQIPDEAEAVLLHLDRLSIAEARQCGEVMKKAAADVERSQRKAAKLTRRGSGFSSVVAGIMVNMSVSVYEQTSQMEHSAKLRDCIDKLSAARFFKKVIALEASQCSQLQIEVLNIAIAFCSGGTGGEDFHMAVASFVKSALVLANTDETSTYETAYSDCLKEDEGSLTNEDPTLPQMVNILDAQITNAVSQNWTVDPNVLQMMKEKNTWIQNIPGPEA